MGKSAAARWLAGRGVPVIDTDLLARQVVEPGQPAWAEIQRAFGGGVIAPGGGLDRAALAGMVFGNPAAREKLEAITHPRILVLWREQIETWRAEKHRFAVVVIPLLYETAAEKELDATLCVACSPATQAERLQERGWTREHMAQRLAAQWPVEKKMGRADFVVWSEGCVEVVGQQLERILLGD